MQQNPFFSTTNTLYQVNPITKFLQPSVLLSLISKGIVPNYLGIVCEKHPSFSMDIFNFEAYSWECIKCRECKEYGEC